MTLILGLVAIGIIAWFLTGIGMQGWAGLQTYLGAPKRRPTDVSQQNLVPPPPTKEIIATLASLGFQRLGEAEVKLPSRDPIQYWILVNSDNSVQAETVFGRVAFSSFFKEKFLLSLIILAESILQHLPMYLILLLVASKMLLTTIYSKLKDLEFCMALLKAF